MLVYHFIYILIQTLSVYHNHIQIYVQIKTILHVDMSHVSLYIGISVRRFIFRHTFLAGKKVTFFYIGRFIQGNKSTKTF